MFFMKDNYIELGKMTGNKMLSMAYGNRRNGYLNDADVYFDLFYCCIFFVRIKSTKKVSIFLVYMFLHEVLWSHKPDFVLCQLYVAWRQNRSDELAKIQI